MTNPVFLSHPLSRYEKLLGAAWLLFETLLFPRLLQLLNLLLPIPLPQAEVNFVFFAVNFAVAIFVLRSFLWGQLKIALQYTEKVLTAAVLGFVAYWALNFLVSGLILYLDPDFTSVNDDAVAELVAQNFPLMFFGTVVLVPVAEECLFRGIVFRGLYDRSHVLAWIVSASLFALVHILGYIDSIRSTQLLLCFLQYIPAGICLAASYRLSGSILSPILIHAAVNFVGMMILRCYYA